MVEADDGLFYLVDMEGRSLYTSPALYAFTGRETGKAAGHGWHETIHPNDVDYVRTFFSEAQGKKLSFVCWWRMLRNDGVYAWTMVAGMPFISELSGAPIGYLGSIHPLDRLDAFDRAGGVIGPDAGRSSDPKDKLPKVEKIADLTLMASALARENGETELARALDEALMTIGFRLAQLMNGRHEAPRVSARGEPTRRRATRGGKARRRIGERANRI